MKADTVESMARRANDQTLTDPSRDDVGGVVDQREKLPSRLSPSRAQDFLDCPKKFYFKTIVGLADPPNIHTMRGTLTHEVLDRLFDFPRAERTAERALSLIPDAWHDMINPDPATFPEEYLAQRALSSAATYQDLLMSGTVVESELLATVETMVRNYFGMEDPSAFDPEGRELRLTATAAGVPLHGIIDRLDKVPGPDGDRWYISDYKTAGKIPSDRYLDGKFFGMRVYALLIAEELGITVTGLRLIFLKGGKPSAIKFQPVTEKSIAATRTQMKSLWQTINDAARRDVWPTRTGPLCNWCPFMDICPAWASELGGPEPRQAGSDTGA
jgi:putative RecB family exonuclease